MRNAGVVVLAMAIGLPIARLAAQNEARPPAAASPKIVRVTVCRPPGPPDLVSLVRESTVVAIGEVTSILQQGPIPMDPLYHGQPHGYYTLYNFKVSRYLRGKDKGEIRVFEHGMATNSLVVIDDDNPLLETGKKYIVFLRQLIDGPTKKLGYIPYGYGSDFYKMAELDTYFMTAPCISTFEIVNSTVHAARDRFRAFKDRHFTANNSSLFPESRRTLDIMDQSEKGAVGVIAKAAQWADYFDRRSHGE